MWWFVNVLKTCLHKRKWKGEGFFILFSELAFSLIESILRKKVISFLSYFCKRYKKRKEKRIVSIEWGKLPLSVVKLNIPFLKSIF